MNAGLKQTGSIIIVNVANRLNALVWWLHLLSAKKKGTVSEKQHRKTQVANCFLQSWRSAPLVQESCCLHPSSSSPITFASCSLLNFRLSSLVVHKSWRRIPAPSCWKPHLSGGFWNCLPGPQKRGVSPFHRDQALQGICPCQLRDKDTSLKQGSDKQRRFCCGSPKRTHQPMVYQNFQFVVFLDVITKIRQRERELYYLDYTSV